MNTRTLGILGMVGAPFLLFDLSLNGFSPDIHSRFSSVLDIIYMTTWMASIVGLRRLGAFGTGIGGRIVYIIQLLLLSVANIYNLMDAVHVGTDTSLFRTLDLFWPLSNAFMLVTGFTVWRNSFFRGWHRLVVLAVGLWLPVGFALWGLVGRTFGMLMVSALYSAIAWCLMGIIVVLYSEKLEERARLMQYLHRTLDYKPRRKAA